MTEVRSISIFPYNVKAYLKNALFDPRRNKGIERSIYFYLKKYLNKKNIEVNTYDVKTKTPILRYVYLDMPFLWNFKAWWLIFRNRKKNILICFETPIVIPYNYWRISHLLFKKVFIWADSLVDKKKCFKIFWPQSSEGINTSPKKFNEKKLLAIINRNLSPVFPFNILSPFGEELYSERIRAIEFFEKNIPDDFHLYGRGWNKPKKYSLKEKIFGYKKYVSYRGEVENKIKVLSNFKYSICYENITGVKGFITEKIFDCLKARCVPVYLGATDIEKYIPKNCFIDFREFTDYRKLLDFLNSIDEKTYNRYIENINKLLSDKKFIDTWFEESFAKFFTKNILELE